MPASRRGSPDRAEFSPPAVTLQAALASVGRSHDVLFGIMAGPRLAGVPRWRPSQISLLAAGPPCPRAHPVLLLRPKGTTGGDSPGFHSAPPASPPHRR